MRTLGYDQTSAENIAHLVTLTYADEAIRWTDHTDSITIGEDTWVAAPGAKHSPVAGKTDGSVRTCTAELAAIDDGPLDDIDIALKRYNGCPITIVSVDVGQLAASPIPFTEVFAGYVGSVKTTVARIITINCRGPLTRLRQDITEQYGTSCLNDLGDAFATDRRGHCRAVIMPPTIERSTAYVAGNEILSFVRVPVTVSGIDVPVNQNIYWECIGAGTTSGSMPGDYTGASVDDVVTDGTAIFMARNAWVRDAEVDTVPTAMSFTLTESPDPRSDATDNFYALGFAIIRSGRYAGRMVPIRSYDKDTFRVRTWDVVSHMIDEGTLIEISPGCPKTIEGCTQYGQILNRQAWTDAPGSDALRAQA